MGRGRGRNDGRARVNYSAGVITVANKSFITLLLRAWIQDERTCRRNKINLSFSVQSYNTEDDLLVVCLDNVYISWSCCRYDVTFTFRTSVLSSKIIEIIENIYIFSRTCVIKIDREKRKINKYKSYNTYILHVSICISCWENSLFLLL